MRTGCKGYRFVCCTLENREKFWQRKSQLENKVSNRILNSECHNHDATIRITQKLCMKLYEILCKRKENMHVTSYHNFPYNSSFTGILLCAYIFVLFIVYMWILHKNSMTFITSLFVPIIRVNLDKSMREFDGKSGFSMMVFFYFWWSMCTIFSSKISWISDFLVRQLPKSIKKSKTTLIYSWYDLSIQQK